MIVDRLDNWKMYFTGADWEMVADFLASLHKGTAEGEYPLKGDEIFARVMSYETRDPEKAALEAHRRYIDIQSVLEGGEGIAWHETDGLNVLNSYDRDKDVEFFKSPAIFPVRIDVTQGYFAAFFPHDAHMPQLNVKGLPLRVKKVVVKIKASLYSK